MRTTFYDDSVPGRMLLRVGGSVGAVLAAALVVLLRNGAQLDLSVLLACNALAAGLPGTDALARLIDTDLAQLLVGAGLTAVWFAARGLAAAPLRRRALLAALAFAPAYAIARLLQGALHRPRPIVSLTLHPLGNGRAPQEIATHFHGWGSFPSDHAALLALIAAMAFSLDRRAGAAYAALTVVVALERVAAGYHWPADVVGGALIGMVVAIALLACERVLRPALDALVRTIVRRRVLAYPLAFLFLADLAQGFRYARLLAYLVFNARIFH